MDQYEVVTGDFSEKLNGIELKLGALSEVFDSGAVFSQEGMQGFSRIFEDLQVEIETVNERLYGANRAREPVECTARKTVEIEVKTTGAAPRLLPGDKVEVDFEETPKDGELCAAWLDLDNYLIGEYRETEGGFTIFSKTAPSGIVFPETARVGKIVGLEF